MSDATITLYGDAFYISPYVFNCYVALKEKGVPFTYTPIALQSAEQRSADFAAKSVTSRVPALTHGDFALAESSAIVEYLEDVFTPPSYPALLPRAPRDRARARQIMAWIRSDLMALREERSTHTMFYQRATRPLSDAGRAAVEKLFRVADGLLPAGKPTLFGDLSIADADLAFMLDRLIRNGDDVPNRLRDYAIEILARPSAREFLDVKRIPYVDYTY